MSKLTDKIEAVIQFGTVGDLQYILADVRELERNTAAQYERGYAAAIASANKRIRTAKIEAYEHALALVFDGPGGIQKKIAAAIDALKSEGSDG